ncbi:MAG TPA: exosortase/archaeosortase family protein [Puia sp.]|nr:exosortase/archaeosortase family protein [Puia sp.]
MIRSSGFRQIPKPVREFLLKATVLFVAWKAVYLLFLLPGRVLDKPLTYVIGKGTAATLSVIHPSGNFNAIATMHPKGLGNEGLEPVMAIRSNQTVLLSIADVCNGLELLMLYAGLILCLPASRSRKLGYIVAGIVLIEIINVIRCAGLVLVYLHKPAYLDFSHHYLFTFVVYAFIFWLWYLFSRDPEFSSKLLHPNPAIENATPR